jgi:hypothetical protein
VIHRFFTTRFGEGGQLAVKRIISKKNIEPLFFQGAGKGFESQRLCQDASSRQVIPGHSGNQIR